jgi:hypothetical protein
MVQAESEDLYKRYATIDPETQGGEGGGGPELNPKI